MKTIALDTKKLLGFRLVTGTDRAVIGAKLGGKSGGTGSGPPTGSD